MSLALSRGNHFSEFAIIFGDSNVLIEKDDFDADILRQAHDDKSFFNDTFLATD